MATKKKRRFMSVTEEKALRSNGVDRVKLKLELKLLEKAQAHSVVLLNNNINRLKISSKNIETSSGSSMRYLKQRTKDTEVKNRAYFMYGERLENRKFYKRSSLLWDKIDKSAYDDEENDKVEDTGPRYPPLELLLESSESEDDGESYYTHECTESGFENIDSGFSESYIGSSSWSRSSSPSVKSAFSHKAKSTPSSARDRSPGASYEEIRRPHTAAVVHPSKIAEKEELNVRRTKSAMVRQASHPKFSWWHGIVDYGNNDLVKDIPPRKHLNAFFPHLGTGDEEPEKLPPVVNTESHNDEDHQKKKEKKKKKKKKLKRTWSLTSSVFSPTVASRQREYSSFLVGRSVHSKNKAT